MTNRLPEWVKDELIKDIIDLLTISETGGAQIAKGSLGIYSDYVNFLYSILFDANLDESESAKDIRNILRKHNLRFGTETGEPIGGELKAVFVTLKKNNKCSYQNFKEEFYATIENLTKAGSKKYSIAYPLNIRLNSRIESQIDGKVFKIVDFNEFRSSVDVDRLLNATGELKELVNTEHSFFVIKDVYAGNTEFAENYCKNRLETVLGLLVFCKYSQAMTIEYKYAKGGWYSPTRISNISLSRALIFESEKFHTARHFNETNPEATSDFETFEDLAFFYAALNLYNKTRGKIAESLRNALISYYQASIDSDLASSYLKYWVCIEFCLLKTKDDRESSIAKMLRKLPFWTNKYVAYKAQLLGAKRNEYVHELKTDVSQYDRNFAKLIAGGLLQYLLLNGDKFSDVDELRRHYRLIGESEQNLDLALKEVKQLQNVKRSLFNHLGKE
jgi:hypothetical protein